jgi:CRP-like cAMP-binding protein
VQGTSEAKPIANRLIGMLPDDIGQRLMRIMEPVQLGPGEVLYDAGRRIGHLFFPVTAMVSLVCIAESGATAEAALVGNEGVVGIAALLGAESAPNRATTLVAGRGFRLPLAPALEEFRRGGPFQLALLRYTHGLVSQVSQNALCNGLHSLEKRLCRRLLLTCDRAGTDEIRMTQEAIAQMLGVRREGITAAARQLQAAGLIRYARGHVVILDRAGLEAAACECYRVVRGEFERMIGPRRAA